MHNTELPTVLPNPKGQFQMASHAHQLQNEDLDVAGPTCTILMTTFPMPPFVLGHTEMLGS